MGKKKNTWNAFTIDQDDQSSNFILKVRKTTILYILAVNIYIIWDNTVMCLVKEVKKKQEKLFKNSE